MSSPNVDKVAPPSRLSSARLALVWLIALILSCAASRAEQLELGFPSQPEHAVMVPPRGPVVGAKLYAPEGAGPFPAVVLSHPSGPLQQHMFQWAQRLLHAGYVTLVVDHLSPRGKKTNLDHSISVTEYAQDDVAALKHLRAFPFVDGKRIAQMGFSYGAMAGLREASAGFRTKNLGGERFAAIVSVYPWCNEQVGQRYQDHQWNFYEDTDIPLLLVLGADDNEADPRSCVERAKANAGKGLPVEYTLLPNTTHAFDHTWMGDKVFTSQQAGHTVTYRYNPEAVETTLKLALDFLARRMGDPAPR